MKQKIHLKTSLQVGGGGRAWHDRVGALWQTLLPAFTPMTIIAGGQGRAGQGRDAVANPPPHNPAPGSLTCVLCIAPVLNILVRCATVRNACWRTEPSTAPSLLSPHSLLPWPLFTLSLPPLQRRFV